MERILTPTAQAVLDQPTEVRTTYILEDRFVEYPRARTYTNRMRALLTAPTVGRPDCLIFVGEACNGKTSLVRNFVRHYAAPVDDPNEPSARIPALHITFRAEVDEVRLSRWILEALCAPYKDKDQPDKNFRMIRGLTESLSVRLLVFDEFHHILNTTAQRQGRALNAIKTLTTELQLPIIATGIPEVCVLLRKDPQIYRRFKQLPLPLWKYGMEFRQFLAGLEQDLPLRKASNLAGKDLSLQIYNLTEGLLGEVIALIHCAATAALDTTEQITPEVIASLDFVPPSLREAELARELNLQPDEEN